MAPLDVQEPVALYCACRAHVQGARQMIERETVTAEKTRYEA